MVPLTGRRWHPDLGEEPVEVDFVPSLDDQAILDAENRCRRERHLLARGRNPHEASSVPTGPALARADEILLAEDSVDAVVKRIEPGEEGLDGLSLPCAAATLAVVDEIVAEQPLACRRVAPVDGLGVEAANDV